MAQRLVTVRSGLVPSCTRPLQSEATSEYSVQVCAQQGIEHRHGPQSTVSLSARRTRRKTGPDDGIIRSAVFIACAGTLHDGSGKAIKQVNVYHLHHSYVSVFCKAFTPQRTSHDLDARRDGRHRPPNGTTSTTCDSEVVYMTTHHEPSYHKAWSAAPGRMSSGFGAGLTSTRPLRMTIVVDVLPPIKPPVLKPGALDRMAIEQSGTMRQWKTDAPPAPLLLLLSPLSADPRA